MGCSDHVGTFEMVEVRKRWRARQLDLDRPDLGPIPITRSTHIHASCAGTHGSNATPRLFSRPITCSITYPSQLAPPMDDSAIIVIDHTCSA